MERDSSPGKQDQIVQLALAPAPHRNQQLFSDHYLNVLLPARPDWQALEASAECFSFLLVPFSYRWLWLQARPKFFDLFSRYLRVCHRLLFSRGHCFKSHTTKCKDEPGDPLG